MIFFNCDIVYLLEYFYKMGNLSSTTEKKLVTIGEIIDEFDTLENFVNCYLVNEGVRPAYLYQHHNLDKEQTREGLIKLMNACHKHFPELNMYLCTTYGLFISQTNINTTKKNNNCNDIGDILGYPQGEVKFTEINRDIVNYGYHIKVIITDTPNSNIDVDIFSMISQNSIIEKLVTIKNDIEKCLKSEMCPLSQYVDKITCDEEITYPPLYLAGKLAKNETLTEDEYADVINYIWNIYDSTLSEYSYQLDNPVHRGILISLLIGYKYDVVEPLYGTKFGSTDLTKKMSAIREKYSAEVVKQLDMSRV